MLFGKYRGWRLADIPTTYLQWLYELEDLREPLRSAVDREWRSRFEDEDAEPDDFPDQDAALFRELIEAGYRALAQRLHPDHGGSTEAMQRLNALMARLRRGALAA